MKQVFGIRSNGWKSLMFLLLPLICMQGTPAGFDGSEGGTGVRIRSLGKEDVFWVFNTEPIHRVSLGFHLMEVRPAETVDLGIMGIVDVADGESAEGTFWWAKDQGFIFRAGLHSRKDGFEILLTLSDLNEVPFAEKTVLVENYRSVLIDVLENPEAGSRIALQITPKAHTIPPHLPFPGEVKRLVILDGILLMNSKTAISSGFNGVVGGAEPCLFAYVSGRGRYLISPKPFSGAEIVGGIEGRKLRFRMEQDTFVWTAAEPILGPGKWLLWGRRDPGFVPTTHPWYADTQNFVGFGGCETEE